MHVVNLSALAFGEIFRQLERVLYCFGAVKVGI